MSAIDLITANLLDNLKRDSLQLDIDSLEVCIASYGSEQCLRTQVNKPRGAIPKLQNSIKSAFNFSSASVRPTSSSTSGAIRSPRCPADDHDRHST